MQKSSRFVLGGMSLIACIMIMLLGFRIGTPTMLSIGRYSPLAGAFIGGLLVLFATLLPQKQASTKGTWNTREKWAWVFVGSGCIAWGIGECFWRYYLAHGQS